LSFADAASRQGAVNKVQASNKDTREQTFILTGKSLCLEAMRRSRPDSSSGHIQNNPG
jgi:hypothetical protein